MESDFEKRFDEMTERLLYAVMRRRLRNNVIAQMSARMEEGY